MGRQSEITVSARKSARGFTRIAHNEGRQPSRIENPLFFFPTADRPSRAESEPGGVRFTKSGAHAIDCREIGRRNVGNKFWQPDSGNPC